MVTIPGPAPRKSAFWIDSFCELTKDSQAPLIFRKWGAVMTIAGALERKVWAKAVRGRVLYPNLYVLLVGGPGIGKTDTLREVRRYWEALPELHVAPSSVSRASLIDSLFDAKRSILRPADILPFTEFNSLQVGATEFGTFLTAYDGEFISTLNDIYDCIHYKERKRGNKLSIEIANPQLNLIAGTTPAWLGSSLPETAWSEGFSSRLLMIFSGERVRVKNLFGEADYDAALDAILLSDLQRIHNLYGQFRFDQDMADAFIAGYEVDFPPIPEHPKLEHYIPRRHIHLLKLCMIMSAARSDDLVITLEDYQRALDFLIEAEALMPDVFKSIRSTTSDANVYDEAYNFVHTQFIKTQEPIAEHRVIAFLGQRAPSYAVTKILDTMVDSRMLIVKDLSGPGGRRRFVPTPRHELGH